MADAHVSKSCAARHEGSTPSSPTICREKQRCYLCASANSHELADATVVIAFILKFPYHCPLDWLFDRRILMKPEIIVALDDMTIRRRNVLAGKFASEEG